MSKDPAFLFYPNDWMGGTQWMTMEQKGCYMELLILQFNTGKFTETQAMQVLSICFNVVWDAIKCKFKKDGNYYYNERLMDEINKRRRFTESRRNNGLTPKKHMLKHMGDGNEDENKDKNTIDNRKRKPFIIPTIEEVQKYFTDNGYKAEVGLSKWHYYNDANWFDSHGNKVLNWKQKMRAVWFKDEYKLKRREGTV